MAVDWLQIINSVLIGGYIFVWSMHLLAIVAAKLRLNRPIDCTKWVKSRGDEPFPGVTILKPLKGEDPLLEENLESAFNLTYPRYEVLICIADKEDPGNEIAKKVMKRYPQSKAKLLVGGPDMNVVGINPKINNMNQGYEVAKYELIMISDQGIFMQPDCLSDMVMCLLGSSSEIGLVHQLPFISDKKGKNFPSTLETVYFGTVHARVSLFADFVGANCCTGMSTLTHKKLLDEVGGLKSFGTYLAEDFFIAQSLMKRGFKLRVSSQPALQNSAISSVESFHSRIERWAKLRFAMVPHTIVLEPVSECLVLGVVASLSLSHLSGVNPFSIYLFHILTWFLLDYFLLTSIQPNGALPFTKVEFVVAWTFRECMAIKIFLRALWDPIITWRAGSFKLRWGGEVEKVKHFMDFHDSSPRGHHPPLN